VITSPINEIIVHRLIPVNGSDFLFKAAVVFAGAVFFDLTVVVEASLCVVTVEPHTVVEVVVVPPCCVVTVVLKTVEVVEQGVVTVVVIP